MRRRAAVSRASLLLLTLSLTILPAMLVVSCAGPDKLARQSEQELAAGHPREAYEKARRALDKEPDNPRARAAMTAAAVELARDRKDRILALATDDQDTVAAAGVALELGTFRTELARYHVTLPADTMFAPRERRIRLAAARVYYGRAERDLGAHRAKDAYDEFRRVREFVPGYRDVDERVKDAFNSALTRVAILPFNNETDVPELSRRLDARIQEELAQRITPHEFRFTRLMGREEVLSQMAASDVDRLDRESALRVARKLGADRVVWGRFYSLQTNTNSDSYHLTLYHREMEQDRKGEQHTVYAEQPLDAYLRDRDISVHYELEVLDVHTRALLAHRSESLRRRARVAYTNFVAEGDCHDYSLAPPDARTLDADSVKSLETGWRRAFGTWTLPDFLERARWDTQRAHYRPEYRSDFDRDTDQRPVFLAELPPEGDLATIALDDVWRPMLDVLAELDPK